jgi:hypothetical protein
MTSHTKTHSVELALYGLAVLGALALSLPARAQNAEAVLNFVSSIGDAVGCSVLSDEEGQTLLKSTIAAALANGLPSQIDFQQAYNNGVRAGKTAACDLFKEHPEIGPKLRDAARRQLSLSSPLPDASDDAAIDAQAQRNMLSSLAADAKVVVRYVPDPKIADKAAAVQAAYDAWNVAASAGVCGLLPESSFDLLSKVWYHDLGVLVPDGRDFQVAFEHNRRVFERAYPWLGFGDKNGCARLAQSRELSDVKRRLEELK